MKESYFIIYSISKAPTQPNQCKPATLMYLSLLNCSMCWNIFRENVVLSSSHFVYWKHYVSWFFEYIEVILHHEEVFEYSCNTSKLYYRNISTWIKWKSRSQTFYYIFEKTRFHHFFNLFYEIFIFRDFFNIWSSYFGKSKSNKSFDMTVILLKQSEAVSAKIAEEEKASYFRCRFVIIYHI